MSPDTAATHSIVIPYSFFFSFDKKLDEYSRAVYVCSLPNFLPKAHKAGKWIRYAQKTIKLSLHVIFTFKKMG